MTLIDGSGMHALGGMISDLSVIPSQPRLVICGLTRGCRNTLEEAVKHRPLAARPAERPIARPRTPRLCGFRWVIGCNI